MKPLNLAVPQRHATPHWWWMPMFLFVALVLLFMRNILPDHILFSNDGPLGANNAASMAMPSGYKSVWSDLNALGNYAGSLFMPVTGTLLWALGPVWFAKIYAVSVLFLLGCSAAIFFHQVRLSGAACLVGGLATALNSTFFSSACWGVAAHEVAIAMSFLAMAAVVGGKGIIRLMLAGFAVGVGVMEAADVGAILSLYVAGFILYFTIRQPGSAVEGVGRGVGRNIIVAGFAAFIAAHSLTGLVSTQIKGVAGTQQDTQTKQERWDFATQWSLPKREALGIVVPGLFGYRMDTPDGGVYWGAVGRDPAWYHYWDGGSQGSKPSQTSLRFSGGGIYAGVLVAIVAFWAALQSFRKEDSVFSPWERRLIWFWVGVIAVSLPLAFGRFAPFYQILYAFPYFSTIRNPGKFLFPTSIALNVLFAYGVHGLWKRYMENVPGAASPYAGVTATFRTWWQRVRGFDRRWTIWSLAVLGACGLGWMIYASNRQALESYLQEVGFNDPALASSIASFSFTQVGLFVVRLAIAILLVTLVLAGVFRGSRAKWGTALLGLFLVVDLGWANQPWIKVWDYKHKYATNPVIDMLRQKPYEQRVAILPQWFSSAFNVPQQISQAESILNYLYGIEWSQHLFLYYNIQSLDIIQMPRMPADLLAFDRLAFMPRTGNDLYLLARKWQLTNTRYILGASAFLDVLNQTADPLQHRFRYAERFNIAPKPGYDRSMDAQDWTAVPDTNGAFAVIEFAGALPRAKLYSNWEFEATDAEAAKEFPPGQLSWADQQIIKNVGTNGFINLRRLGSQSFEPEKTVMVEHHQSVLPSSSTNAVNAGTVDFVSYAPKDIVFNADAKANCVMLLNDRYDPNWKVLVDGKSQPVLRCNFIMRGVQLTPGPHRIEFKFEPPMGSFYVSLVAVIIGLLLLGILGVQALKPKPVPAKPAPAPEQRPAIARK